ncbi:hypothetical protein CLU96_1930 [Chryseobacterium sp. 52]|uniref:hypothetical protein n=1 Tax=Chryseobacterium sp. 52 TaxID=2035213 RepID=UPI000C530F50|nr:hypothetical protein [Chryseobacterium sp. 52]PIF44931.1 hypothetical protein CLU96_1930 [Chryseobacterium sp. 52]
MDKLFNINFKQLAMWWIPTYRRKPVTLNYLWCLIFPLETMYIEFLRKRKQNLIKMNYNYQKYSVQKRLNDAFDQVERRIRIVKAVQYEGIYLYTEAEDDPQHSKTQWLYDESKPIYLRTEAELYSEYDFIVEIPNTGINLLQLRAEIDFYILQSKQYQIVII